MESLEGYDSRHRYQVYEGTGLHIFLLPTCQPKVEKAIDGCL